MKNLFVVLLVALFVFSVSAQKKQPYQTVKIENSNNLQNLVDKAVSETLTKFEARKLKPEDIAVTLIDVSTLKSGNHRGEEKIYPASVSKMFYMVALHQQLENGKVKITPEIERALRDMIIDSSNEATQFLVDVITNTSSGRELAPKEFEKWAYQRNAVNRYFTSLEYQNINVCQKVFCEDAYGREQQFRGKDGINRNKLTTNATARLMTEIALNKAVTPQRSQLMMDLMKRDWEIKEGKVFDGDSQSHGFTGIALKDLNLLGTKLWSKAGWTSKTRHDVAYLETPNGKKLVLCVFTENHAAEKDIIPNVARIILQEFGKSK
jgi:beta-lactamase class A